MSRISTVTCIAALGLVSVGAGCNALDFVPLTTATKTVSEVFETTSTPKVVVETFNGSIDVSQGATDEVVVEVTKRASAIDQPAAEAALEHVQVSMVQKGDTLEITARRVGPRGINCGASIVIAVPVSAQLKLQSSNGYIVSERVQGAIEAATSNGRLELIEARGPLKATTSNGPIEIEGTDAIVNARTSNGRIQFRGSLAKDEHEFKTSNGKIELRLPADSSFELDCSTSNGKIRCDFPLESKRQKRSKLQGTVGSDPKFSVRAATSNGSIDIRKASAKDE